MHNTKAKLQIAHKQKKQLGAPLTSQGIQNKSEKKNIPSLSSKVETMNTPRKKKPYHQIWFKKNGNLSQYGPQKDPDSQIGIWVPKKSCFRLKNRIGGMVRRVTYLLQTNGILTSAARN